MDFKDYYEIIGVKKDATQAEIKRAYKKLARKYHPDVSKENNAEEKFKELGEAYEALKDPEKRAAYDQLGKNWKAGQDFTPPPDWDAGFEFSGGGFTGANAADHSDFFESLFGRGFQSGNPRAQHGNYQARGEDHHAKVLIDLEGAFNGASHNITLQSPELDNAKGGATLKAPKPFSGDLQVVLSANGLAALVLGFYSAALMSLCVAVFV